MDYIEIKDDNGQTIGIFEPSIGCIPLDPMNRHYQAYLATLASESNPTGGK